MPMYLSTRLTKSAPQEESVEPVPSLLVRIHPVHAIEPPVALGREPVLIGRDERCTLTVDDDSVSRRHALIEPAGDGHVLVDLDSLNGTFVNEKRLNSSQRLETGDRVRIGTHIYKYLTSNEIEAQYHEVLFGMMTTDGLTSVYNKRYLLETLNRELTQASRTGSPLCLMMLDLDKFKAVNDNYGHLAGDAVLVEFARRAKSVLRSGELLARYGGEEFTILLARTSLDEAQRVAERVREVVAATPVVFESVEIPITVSIGVCEYSTAVPASSSSLLAEADQLLYAAKQQGRNRVVTSSRA